MRKLIYWLSCGRLCSPKVIDMFIDGKFYKRVILDPDAQYFKLDLWVNDMQEIDDLKDTLDSLDIIVE